MQIEIKGRTTMLVSTRNKRILAHAVTVSCLLLAALPCYAGVVFEESFNSQADWNVNNTYTTECAGDCTTAPTNWSNYRTVPGTSALTNPTGSIQKLPGALPDHGAGSGKAYIIYNQSVAGVNWPGDSTLVKTLSQDYPEIYVRMWIRTQANWKTVASAQSKVFRSYHWDRTGNVFEFFSTGTVNPAYIWDWSTNSSNNASFMDAYRCDPQETNYYCTASGVPAYQLNDYFYAWGSGGATTKYADAQWHRYDFHLKMNDIGKNNGIMEWWWDGTLMESRTDAQWKAASGSSSAVGWNTIAIGGNSNNTFSGSTPADQWYAIDDLVVSTTAIPADYVIGGGTTVDTTAPTTSISSPANNATVSGTVSVTANASDNVGVARVEYYVNGSLKSTDTSAPYLYAWDTSSVTAGSYTLMTKAYDAAGNSGQSANIGVTVVKDTTPPTVTLSNPVNNAILSGTATLAANASDNIGVSRVEFYSNGTLVSATNVTPYSYSWNTTSVANGAYTLTAKAYDASNNIGQSSNISVTVNNGSVDTTAPTVAVASPAAGSTVSGTVNVAASVSDNVGVTKVEYYVNGGLDNTVTAAPFSYSVPTTVAHNGSYTLYAKAYDAAGNVKQSATISFSINNTVTDTTLPTVSISAPAANATVSGTVSITATASDNIGVSKVEFYVNNALKGTDTASPYAYSWDTKSVVNGTYSLTTKAYDAAGNVKTSVARSVIVKNSVTTDTTAPTVSISSPAAGSTVKGTLNFAVSATDNVGVKKVEYYFNGGLGNTITAAPFSYSVPTTVALNGSYTMYAKAYDAAGNVKQSATISFTIKN